MHREKRKSVNFTPDNSEEYYLPFSHLELKQTLQKSNDSAVGPDNIHYRLLTNLPGCSLSLGNPEYFCFLGEKPL